MIRSHFANKVELPKLCRIQLEINGINFRIIYEDYRSLPNDADPQSKFSIFNMGVDVT